MQNSEFFFLLERVGRERGLSSEALLKSVEEALTSAYKKKYNQPIEDLKVLLDEKNERLRVLVTKEVVEKVYNPGIEISLEEGKQIDEKVKLGDKIEVETDPLQFSRIAASTGKYVMMQQIVEMEKDQIYEEFKKREGEIISGTVRYRAHPYILVPISVLIQGLPLPDWPGFYQCKTK